MECESTSPIQSCSDGNTEPCHMCGVIISRRSDVPRHLDIHEHEKRYPCDWPGCDYGANQKKNLETHMNKHTGARPYQCDYCNWAFGDPGSKTRHMKRKHGYIPMAKKPRHRVPVSVKDSSIKKTKHKSANQRLNASPSFSSDSSLSSYTGSPSSLTSSSFSSPDPLDFTFLSDDLLDMKIEESSAVFTDGYSTSGNALQYTPAYDSLLFSTLDMDISTGNYAEEFAEFMVGNGQQSFLGPLDTSAPDTVAFVAQNSLALYLNDQKQVSSDQPWMNNNFFIPEDYASSPQTDYLLENTFSATSTLLDMSPSIWIPEWNQDHLSQLY